MYKEVAVPRISLWREGAHSNDYKFFDARIFELFTQGGTTVNVHKYIGAPTTAEQGDATQPVYTTQSEQNIQDLLFLENRDRKYDPDVYNLRGIYNVSDVDFDLSQFGLFLQNDTLFIVFHLNDMIDRIGRKIMSGDVIELPHLREFFPLDSDLAPLRGYYTVTDATRASEGYSPTWWPHLWRIKCTPLVDGQEYRDILNQDNNTLKDLLSTYNTQIAINDAVVSQALAEVPKAGYDTSMLYTLPIKEDGSPKIYEVPTADSAALFADSDKWSANSEAISPTKEGYHYYLKGDNVAPNGFPFTSGISFPLAPLEGDYFLRVDYFPNRMFRFNGKKWSKVHDVVRNTQLPNNSKNQIGTFVNNSNVTQTSDGRTLVEKQGLSKVLRAQPDE